MLNLNRLKKFFEENNIPLAEEKFLGEKEIDFIFVKAISIEKFFATFLIMTVFNSEKNGFQTNFSSFEDLFESYSCFMVGAMGFKC